MRPSLITENENDGSSKQTETESMDGSDVCGEFPKKFLPTLPFAFKSLFDTPVDVETDRPAELIELLGNLLEITNYADNMASFWFLDTLALQVLRYKDDLDEHYMSVLISWLAGEMKLLRDRKCSREEFFKEMKKIFLDAANKVLEQKQLLYWEEIVFEHDTEEEAEEKLSAKSLSLKSSQKPSSKKSFVPPSNIDPLLVLDIIMKATYDMYANELRYFLVYATFVEPIEIQTYNLPFTFRTPRPVKSADPEMVPFITELQRSLKRIEIMEKSKKPIKVGKKKKMEVPPPPPPSLDDEMLLTCKRMFILPLIEANEAEEMFDKQLSEV